MGYKGALMRSLNRPTAAKLGPPRQRFRKQTSGGSSTSSSSSSSSTSSLGGGVADARSSNSSSGGGGSASSSSGSAAADSPATPPDGLAPRKKLYISYNDIDVPAKIALTKISRRTKVLVYGKERRKDEDGTAALSTYGGRGNALKCLTSNRMTFLPSFHPTMTAVIEGGREGGRESAGRATICQILRPLAATSSK